MVLILETKPLIPGLIPTSGCLITSIDFTPEDVSALLERFTAVPAATRFGGIPATGWARLAMVLHPLHGSTDCLVLVDLAEGSTIVIDWGRKDYWWPGGGVIPIDPTISNVRIFRGQGARLPYMLEEPDDLSTLLWHVGLHAFPTTPAWWLTDDVRYQLSRWPDFTAFAHSPDHVRLTALLGQAPHTATELARAGGVQETHAQRLINTLSLMGLVREVPIEDGAPAPQTTERPRGLFGRLRARWGL